MIGGVTVQIVRDWVAKLNAHGPAGLIDRRGGGTPPTLSDEHRRALALSIEDGPIPAVHGVVRWRVIDPCQWLPCGCPSRRSAASCGGWATAGTRPGRATTRKRMARSTLSKSLPARLDAIGRAQDVGREGVEVWFADEARVGQKNTITRRWQNEESGPPHPRTSARRRTYIFGAICPEMGVSGGLVLPWCNTEAMGLHFAEIADRVTTGRHCALLVDQAGLHTSERLVVPVNITIVKLPAKCPELNPVANVWQFLRGNWVSNRVFAFHDAIVDHCCDAWNRLV